MRVGTGGKAAVAAAAALISLALAGPPLYVSSATSEALQTAVASACPSDTGVLLHVDESAVADLDARAAAIDHLRPPLHTELTTIRLRDGDVTSPAHLAWRDDLGSAEAGSIAEPAPNQVALPGSYAATAGLRAGDRLDATSDGGGARLGYTVAGIYPDVPVQPAPPYWCGLSQLLAPDGSGSAPAPLFLAARPTVRSAAAGPPVTLWEARPDPDHLTRSSARALADQLAGLAASVGSDARPSGSVVSPVAERPVPALARLIDDADAVGDTVSRGLIGLRLAIVAVALGLLVAASRRVAQAHRPELLLRLVHGERVGGVALRLAERLAVPVIAGTVVGTAGTYAAVRGLGPAPDVDTSAVWRAALLAAVGLVASLAAAAGVGAARADRWVDQPPRPARRRFLPPWELVPIVLAVVAYSRLDRAAGVRIVGTGVPAGDGLGDAFPVLALVAAAVVVRPLRWLFLRARHGGHRLGPGVLRGWRRLGADPARHAWFAGLVMLGTGAAVVASSLGLTTDRLVRDKATTFLGSDLRVVTASEPVIPAGLDATPISRLSVTAGGRDVQVIGIDPDTFARAVHWRDDAAEYPLDELLRVLSVDDMKGAPLPAVVVGGPVPEQGLRGEGADIDITPVATAAFFPGKTSVPLVVVNRNALAADEVPVAAEIWLRDPPDDAPRVLAAAGNLVRGSQGSADVFGTASVQAVRWADEPLWVVAGASGVAALMGALLLVGTRRRERQAARAVERRLGEPARQELVAALVACGIPAVIGLGSGSAAAAIVLRLLGEHADPVGNLPPPARVVYDLLPVAAAAAAAGLLVLVAAVGSRLDLDERSVGEVNRRATVV